MRQRLTIVKIGGNIIDTESALEGFLTNFQQLPGRKILVHGGGKLASNLATKLGIVPQMVDGRRITDKDTLKIVTMVYAGLINKTIVAKLQSRDCDAIGLTGADANLVTSKKRSAQPIDFGYVGDVAKELINANRLQGFLAQNLCPVFCAITHDREGNLLNTNADSMAAVIAVALVAEYQVELQYCFEKAGVLREVSDETSVMPVLTRASVAQMQQQGKIHAGMLPKLHNALYAKENGVTKVIIKHAANLLTADGTDIML